MSSNDVQNINPQSIQGPTYLSYYHDVWKGKNPPVLRDLAKIYEQNASLAAYHQRIRFDWMVDNHIYQRGQMQCEKADAVRKMPY